jgi:hypothetical protein
VKANLALRLAKLEAGACGTVRGPAAVHVIDLPTALARQAEIVRMIGKGEADEHDIFFCIVSPQDSDRGQEPHSVDRLH